ncbi:hypothetical protein OHV05_35625 (plasmid) [Kitasatospora sp. NBC_00070]|uniref:hypothetical protein n=1 Tax=Kitasatospora sp. NBC_00070 TaxID=2975962 RepID=UPI002F90FE69
MRASVAEEIAHRLHAATAHPYLAAELATAVFTAASTTQLATAHLSDLTPAATAITLHDPGRLRQGCLTHPVPSWARPFLLAAAYLRSIAAVPGEPLFTPPFPASGLPAVTRFAEACTLRPPQPRQSRPAVGRDELLRADPAAMPAHHPGGLARPQLGRNEQTLPVLLHQFTAMVLRTRRRQSPAVHPRVVGMDDRGVRHQGVQLRPARDLLPAQITQPGSTTPSSSLAPPCLPCAGPAAGPDTSGRCCRTMLWEQTKARRGSTLRSAGLR